MSENMIFPHVSVHAGCVHALQLWARNCQFGPNSQQKKLSHCKFCSNLALPAQKANFVDFPRFPGSVLNGAVFSGESIGEGHTDRKPFHQQWKPNQRLAVLLGFQRKQKNLWTIHRTRFLECRHGTSNIYLGLSPEEISLLMFKR